MTDWRPSKGCAGVRSKEGGLMDGWIHGEASGAWAYIVYMRPPAATLYDFAVVVSRCCMF